MAEKEMKTSLDKIEKLIVDGQKELMGEIIKLKTGQSELQDGQREMGGKIDRLEMKVDKIDRQEAVNAAAAYELLTDVRKEVGEVNQKLDAHLKVPPACR